MFPLKEIIIPCLHEIFKNIFQDIQGAFHNFVEHPV